MSTTLSTARTTETLERARAALRAGDRKAAVRALQSRTDRNRLRRVQIRCHGWVRDAVAAPGDHVWCEACSDWRRVTAVAE